MINDLMIKILIAVIFCFSTRTFADVQSTREVLSHYSSSNPRVLEVYDAVTKDWIEYGTSHEEFDLEKLLKAIEFATEKHEGQAREDAENTPYIIYPMGVSKLLWDYAKIRTVYILSSAILLDTLKSTSATEIEIKALFGSRILSTVKEVTDDPSLSIEENRLRKIEIAPTMWDGKLVTLADCLYNANELYPPPSSWTEEEINEYFLWAQKLVSALNGTNNALESAIQLRIYDYQNKINGSHIISNIEYKGGAHRAFFLSLSNNTRWSIPEEIYHRIGLNLKVGETVEISPFGDHYLMKFPQETAIIQGVVFGDKFWEPIQRVYRFHAYKEWN